MQRKGLLRWGDDGATFFRMFSVFSVNAYISFFGLLGKIRRPRGLKSGLKSLRVMWIRRKNFVAPASPQRRPGISQVHVE
jgi:hypothetical protein